jgi:dTDP-4-dehydrorhamnose reductase
MIVVVGRGYLGRSLHAAMSCQDAPVGALDAALSRDIESAAAVVWASGTKAVHACESDPAMAARLNMQAAAAAARRASGAFVYVSTDYVFDGERGGYSASDAPNPKTAYGVSKLRGEDAVLAACDRAVVVRTAHVIAHGCPWIEWLVGQLESGVRVDAWEDRFNTPTSIGVLGTGILSALREGRRGVIHCVGHKRQSRLELFRDIAEARGLNGALVVPGVCDNPLVPRDLSLVST